MHSKSLHNLIFHSSRRTKTLRNCILFLFLNKQNNFWLPFIFYRLPMSRFRYSHFWGFEISKMQSRQINFWSQFFVLFSFVVFGIFVGKRIPFDISKLSQNTDRSGAARTKKYFLIFSLSGSPLFLLQSEFSLPFFALLNASLNEMISRR